MKHALVALILMCTPLYAGSVRPVGVLGETRQASVYFVCENTASVEDFLDNYAAYVAVQTPADGCFYLGAVPYPVVATVEYLYDDDEGDTSQVLSFLGPDDKTYFTWVLVQGEEA